MSSLRPVSGATESVVNLLADWLAAPAEPEPLVVETSGSTGRPKRVVLSRRAMVASAEATHAHLAGPGQWLLALPITYVAGLQVAVRSLLAGRRPIEVDDWTEAAARAASPAYTSLVPTQLHRLLDDEPARAALARLDAVLLGGGPIDPVLRRRAEEAGITVVATYGASETSGGCVYDGVPLPGVRLDLDATGRVRIAGPMLFDGYLDDPALTAEALVDGWYLTSDLGRMVDGRLQLLGRVDDVVVSGGVNVPTPAVAARLREHPALAGHGAQVEVLGVPDEEWGSRVVAFATGDPTSLPDLAALRDWVGASLERAWAPRQLVVLAELPLLDNGKLDRMALRRIAGEQR